MLNRNVRLILQAQFVVGVHLAQSLRIVFDPELVIYTPKGAIMGAYIASTGGCGEEWCDAMRPFQYQYEAREWCEMYVRESVETELLRAAVRQSLTNKLAGIEIPTDLERARACGDQ